MRNASSPWIRRLAIAVALSVVPGVAIAATISVKGKLANQNKLLNPVWNEAKEVKNHRYTFREQSATVSTEARQLTGYLPKELCIAVLADKGVPNKQPLRMTIAGGRTTPVTLVVAESQQIEFFNNDPFPHRLHDLQGKLGAADITANGRRGWTAPAPGKYEIRDDSSPSIRSWIVVESKTVGAFYPDAKGDSFTVEVDQPGKYKLRGYYNGEPVGQDLEVNIASGPAEQLLKAPLSVGEPSAPADAGADK